MFGLNLSSIDLTHLETIWKPLEPVSDAIKTARDVAIDVGMGVRDMTAGVVRDLANGDIGEALASAERGYDRALFSSVERVDYGLLYGAQHAVDIAADALGPLGEPIEAVADRGFDIAFTGVDTVASIVREEARLLPDMATGLISDLERSVELAGSGRWGAAAGQLAMAGVNVATAPATSMFDMGVVALHGAADIVQTAAFLEPAGRPLTDDEIDYLKTVYGDSIDYGLVRIKEGTPLTNALNTAITFGNTLDMPASAFTAPGTWAPGQLDYFLAHEVGHVWQDQNGGLDYIHRALGAQLTKGSGGFGAYFWQTELASGKTFATMNPEAQAEMINDLALALADGTIDTTDVAALTGRALSSTDVQALKRLAAELGWGTGAG